MKKKRPAATKPPPCPRSKVSVSLRPSTGCSTGVIRRRSAGSGPTAFQTLMGRDP